VAGAVSVLCALTCLVCLGLLLRAYSMTGGRLIFWTALCFAGLAISNVLLAVDEIVVPSVDLSWRVRAGVGGGPIPACERGADDRAKAKRGAGMKAWGR
jgi:hypothetical protein